MGHASRMPRQKGCHLCKPHKHRDAGQSHRKAFAELRRLGKLRRVSRHDLGDFLADDVGETGPVTSAVRGLSDRGDHRP